MTWNSNAESYIIMLDDSVIAVSPTTTYHLTGLAANTQYTFAVQAVCGDFEAAVTSISFTTLCGAETMPWAENFDNWSVKSPCWSFLSGAFNGGNGPASTISSAWTLSSTYGSYISISGKALTMNVYSTNRFWAVTPAISITEDDAMLSVDVAVAAWSNATPNYDDNDLWLSPLAQTTVLASPLCVCSTILSSMPLAMNTLLSWFPSQDTTDRLFASPSLQVALPAAATTVLPSIM
jgi:hypothetical protein